MTDSFKGLRIVFYYTGYIILGFSILNLLPVAVALIYKDYSSALDFILSFSISIIIAIMMMTFGQSTRTLRNSINLRYGLTVASLTWIMLTMLAAIPYMLSGHMLSYLDACFDVMSGFTTTGVFLLQDLDHISQALNFWRHLLTFVGGQGMVVLALGFFGKEIGSANKFYVGEGKDIALTPNVKGTAQWIWKISLVYLAIGTTILWISAMRLGLSPLPAFFHGLYVFQSAWSTGGFAPNYQNIMYYHDFGFELIGMVFFIIGSLNFGLHFALIQGRRKEFFKNIEVISFTVTSLLATALAVYALKSAGIYADAIGLFRRVVYNVISAHTTTGFGSIFARQFALEWGGLGISVMIIAMLIGGSACSTAGGIKGLRIGIIFKGIVSDIKKLVSGENSIKVVKYHHIKDLVLDDAIFRASAVVAVLYIILFTGGVILSTAYGYPLAESAFEVASVTGNVGLSLGIISAQMPTLMKWYYMIAMYLGRLEFISVLAMIGLMYKGAKQWLRRY